MDLSNDYGQLETGQKFFRIVFCLFKKWIFPIIMAPQNWKLEYLWQKRLMIILFVALRSELGSEEFGDGVIVVETGVGKVNAARFQ